MTSDSLIAPTPPWIHLTTTSSLDSFKRLCFTASTLPCTSALMIRFSSFRLPSWILVNRSSSDILDFVSSSFFTLFCATKVSANCFAVLSFSCAIRISPAFGTSERPKISTGVEGPASFTLHPLSSTMALTLPCAAPADTKSPTCSVPFCTRTVATEPRPLSSSASITRPLACLFGFAFSSNTSAVRRIISNKISAVRMIVSSKVSIPSPDFAETGTNSVVPPQSTGISSYSVSSCFTRSILAFGLSILLTATIISIPAAFA